MSVIFFHLSLFFTSSCSRRQCLPSCRRYNGHHCRCRALLLLASVGAFLMTFTSRSVGLSAAYHNKPEAAINQILDSPVPVAGVKVEPASELGGGGEAKSGSFLVVGKVEEVEVECQAERSSVTVARTSIACDRVKPEPPCDFVGIGGGKGGCFCMEERVEKEVVPLVKQESIVKEEAADEPIHGVV